MEQTSLSIDKIEIETFKKIKNLVIEPERGANLFFGSFRSGKTSLCEFIQFILFGADAVTLARDHTEDALGKIFFSYGEKTFLVERSIIGGKEDLSFLDTETGCAVLTDLTPGEYFTGMDRDAFDLLVYFKQAKYESPVCKPSFSFLNELTALNPNTKSIYEDQKGLEEKWLSYRNDEKTGILDRLYEKKEATDLLIARRPGWEAEEEECSRTLEEVTKKLDENDKRCVLIKADMARFSDDLTLSRNQENAEDLLKSIQAKEKKYRLAHYDVTHKVGLLEKDELEEMKNDYNLLSLAVARLSEARGNLTLAEETLTFHRRLFSGGDNLANYGEKKKKISKMKLWKLLFRIVSVVLMGTGASLYFLFRYLERDLVFSLATSLSVLLVGIALWCVSTVFSLSIRKVLEECDKKNLNEFYEFYETLLAHDKTTRIYQEKVLAAEEACRESTAEKDTVTDRIFRKIAALGYSEEDGELLAICDQIIEAGDALYDLEREIQEERAEYERLLLVDVEKESLSVSPEFAALQKELSFLLVQNESLYKKKALLTSRLQNARDHLTENLEDLQKAGEEIRRQIEEKEKDYRALELSLSLANARKDKFETALKERLAKSINSKLSFLLGEGESFLFDEEFELCFCDRNTVLPLAALGGGIIGEMGILAFRLSLGELLGKTGLPMMFDDSFSILSPEAAEHFFRLLHSTYPQYFITTSSPELSGQLSERAKVISL